MSFNLSSLLNPSPDADSNNQPSPSDARRESLPSNPYVQSPEQTRNDLPQYAPPTHQQPSGLSADVEHQALTKFANSTAPPPTTWNGYSAANPAPDTRQPSSGYDAGLELPPPPPSSAQRKMSSPTLDQYHVASRSPEQQRRPSIMSQSQGAITLPPLQQVTSVGSDQTRRQSVASLLAPEPEAASEGNGLSQAETSSHSHVQASDDGNAPAGDGPSHTAATSTTFLEQPLSQPAESERSDPSPANIKEEATQTPRATSPTDTRRPSDMDGSTLKSVSSLKQEYSMRNGSPLRESSVPMPSTEDPTANSTVPKKRPAPKKKGTATSTKKPHPSKKRKLESARADSPASRASKASLKGTPLDSSPVASTRSRSDDEEEEEEEGSPVSDDLYCLCRRPDTGTFMIGCDGTCDDWFHGKCVGIEERDKNFIDKYMCPRCSAAGIGKTTWKRICRRSGCRLPARIQKTKNGKDGSKYCSDECGVTFFREMTASARGRDQAAKTRASRQKPRVVPTSEASSAELGARGGVLAAGEVRAMLDSSKSVDDFKKLGDGVLSPPATPDGKAGDGEETIGTSVEYTEAEKQSLKEIAAKKEAARDRHQLLKDRLKFINMAKQAAARAVTERELKPKEYCGYDSRIEWSGAEFDVWRKSDVGKQAFELETLAVENSGEKDPDRMEEDDDEEERTVCDKKKCARHLEWAKLATDDVRFEMGDNGDKMRGLDREQKGITERAVRRGRPGGYLGEGSVEIHPVGKPSGVDGGTKGGIEEAANGVKPTLEGEKGHAPDLATNSVVAATPPASTPNMGDPMEIDAAA